MCHHSEGKQLRSQDCTLTQIIMVYLARDASTASVPQETGNEWKDTELLTANHNLPWYTERAPSYDNAPAPFRNEPAGATAAAHATWVVPCRQKSQSMLLHHACITTSTLLSSTAAALRWARSAAHHRRSSYRNLHTGLCIHHHLSSTAQATPSFVTKTTVIINHQLHTASCTALHQRVGCGH